MPIKNVIVWRLCGSSLVKSFKDQLNDKKSSHFRMTFLIVFKFKCHIVNLSKKGTRGQIDFKANNWA